MTRQLPPLEGPQEPPELPPAPGAAKLDVAKDRYSHQLDAWLELWKQKVAQQTVKTALEESRRDTATAVQAAKDAAALALKESRDDTGTAVQAAKDAAALALTESRIDTQTERSASRSDADRDAETALLKSVQDAYIAVTSSSLDRALTRVNVLTAAVAAVTTIYTATLAFKYGATNQAGTPLAAFTPAALIPALFLGLSLFLVTIYAAMFRSKIMVGPLLPTGIGGRILESRLITFMKWCFAGVLARSWALHSGIVSFGLGVATLPVPYVKLTAIQHHWILGGGLAVVVIAGVAPLALRRKETVPQAPSQAGPERGDGKTPPIVAAVDSAH